MRSVRITLDQVLAWRLRRQFLEAPDAAGAVEIAGRLCGVQAQVASAAATAVALRRPSHGLNPEPDEIDRGLAGGILLKTWAMRGTLHLFPAGDVGDYLSLIASARTWEKPAWQRNFGATPNDIRALAEAVSTVLDGVALTREELVTRILADGHFSGMERQLRSGWGALFKPLAWQGVLCHGAKQGNRASFARPIDVAPEWKPIPDPDEAAPRAIAGYLGAYGPATPDAFDNWLTRSSLPKATLRRWFAGMGEQLTEVDVEGRTAYVLTEDLDELSEIEPSRTLRLLGPFDQYVLGPGTGDTALLPAEHRGKVSRTAGWISPVVLSGGRIVGTWELQNSNEDSAISVSLFPGVRKPPTAKALRAEAVRTAGVTGTSRLTVGTALT